MIQASAIQDSTKELRLVQCAVIENYVAEVHASKVHAGQLRATQIGTLVSLFNPPCVPVLDALPEDGEVLKIWHSDRSLAR